MEPAVFKLSTHLFSGVGVSSKIPELLRDKNWNSVAVLVDESVTLSSSYYKSFIKDLGDSCQEVNEYKLRSSEEPDYEYLDFVAARVRSWGSLSVVIGIGGGSSLDITKAVSVLLTNKGKGVEYRGFDMVKKPGLPTICIPSTAGSGSEVTINAVFTNKAEKKKLGINGNFMNATYAVLDANWTVSCPYTVALSSGMDALVHSLESFMCKQSNHITRLYSKMAFRLLFSALPILKESPNDLEKLQDILVGANFAAIALFNSGSGIAGALSYPIGVHYKVPHGIAGAIFISSVLKYNVERGYYDYSELYDEVFQISDLTKKQKSEALVEAVSGLSSYLGVPSDLSNWGIGRSEKEKIFNLTMPLQNAFDQNPVKFSAETDLLPFISRYF